MEEISDDRLVAKQVLVPSLLGNLFVRSSVALCVFDEWLLALPVQIFAHQIQNGRDTLMRVVLAVAAELLSIFTQDSLEEVRSDDVIGLIPHLIDELSVSHNQAALCTQRVLDSLSLDKLESLF